MKALGSYFELTKPRLTSLVMVTTWLGFAMASHPMHYGVRFIHAMLGGWLVASGAAAINQYMERERDGQMRRTKRRPLPEGRVSPTAALLFGLGLCLIGALELFFFVNVLTSLLALISLGTYVLLYTPLKTRSSLCTIVGAVPGAIPPMMGWTAATGSLGDGAWALFAILFLWQLPHFLAIAWMYREDYAQAGFPMLPVVDPEGGSTARLILLYSGILIPVSLIPIRMGVATANYLYGAVILGAGFMLFGAFVAFRRTVPQARRLLLASVIYLPMLLAWMVWNKSPS